jgi:hypothetical protein
MSEKIKDIKNKILEKINSSQIYMKPKWFFIVRFIFRLVFAFIVFFAVLYIVSFTALLFKEKGPVDLFGFGPQGMHLFISTIPWLLMFAFLVLVVLLEILVRKFSFIYKKPLLYSLFLLIFTVLLASFTLMKIDRDFRFARFGERPEVPFFGPMHKYYRGDFDKRPMNRKMYKDDGFMRNRDFAPMFPPDEIFYR